MKAFIGELSTFMQLSSTLSYVKSHKQCDDNNGLIAEGKFPWINIQGIQKGFNDIPGFHDVSGDRESFKLIISFAVRGKTKVNVEIGTNGVWDMGNDIWSVIGDFLAAHQYTTQTIYKIMTKPTVFSKSWKASGGLWIAGADMNIEFYEDVFAS